MKRPNKKSKKSSLQKKSKLLVSGRSGLITSKKGNGKSDEDGRKNGVELMEYGPGVWCCAKRWKCLWPSQDMHFGLAWGVVPCNSAWREWHDRECGGKLMQLIMPEKNSQKELDKRCL